MKNLRKLLIKLYIFTAETAKKLGGSRLMFLRKISQFLYSRLTASSVEIDGFTIYVDSKDSLGLTVWGKYEEFELQTIKKFLKSGATVIDIGANIGVHSLYLSKHIGPTGKIFAFEPDSENYELLIKNLKENSVQNVKPIKKAVSNTNGTLQLFLSEQNKADHQIFDSKENRKAVEIESVTLDDYFAEYPTEIDLIKMDIQGAEPLALVGMERTLQKFPNIIVFSEFYPMGMVGNEKTPKAYLSKFASLGFEIYEVNEVNKTFEETDIDTLIARLPKTTDIYTNLMFKRKN